MRYRSGYDVVVAGGGTAGAIAGIAAARTGARTLIVERYGHLGGVLALGMAFHGIVDGEGYWVLGGFGRQALERLNEIGGGTRPSVDPVFGSVAGQDPELLKIVLLQMAMDAGANLLLHSMIVDTCVEQGSLRGIVVAHKGGLEAIEAKVVADCTSDADVVAGAGGEVMLGRGSDSLMQPASRIFRVGGVNLEKMWAHLRDHPEDHNLPENWVGTDFDVDWLAATPGASMEVFGGLIRKAREANDYRIPRNYVSIDTLPGRSEVTVNVTRVHGIDGTDPDDLTRAEVETQVQMAEVMRFLRRYAPGFENARIVATPYQVGVRETRRIVGEYVLSEQDVRSGAEFDDQVGRGAYPLDIHDVMGGTATLGREVTGSGITLSKIMRSYGIPKRALIPRTLDGVTVGGRCISASHEAAGSVRGQSVCMASGHAAGTIAALAALRATEPRNVPTDDAREVLRDQGVILERRERVAENSTARATAASGAIGFDQPSA